MLCQTMFCDLLFKGIEVKMKVFDLRYVVCDADWKLNRRISSEAATLVITLETNYWNKITNTI